MRPALVRDQFRIVETGANALAEILREINTVWSIGHKQQSVTEKFGDRQHGYLLPYSEIGEALGKIAYNQALAFGCLFNDSKKTNTETVREGKLRYERVYEFKRRLQGLPIVQLRNRSIRNALAHFEERYLKALIEANGRPPSILQDLGVSHLNVAQFNNDAFPIRIRVYYYHEDVFYLFSEQLQLEPLYKEIEQINQRLGIIIPGFRPVSRPKLLPYIPSEPGVEIVSR